jgi:hypothetical protein
VEKYGRARQAKDDNIIRRMRFACWITKATDIHTEWVTLRFHCNCYANAPLCYVIRTLPVLLSVSVGQEILSVVRSVIRGQEG